MHQPVVRPRRFSVRASSLCWPSATLTAQIDQIVHVTGMQHPGADSGPCICGSGLGLLSQITWSDTEEALPALLTVDCRHGVALPYWTRDKSAFSHRTGGGAMSSLLWLSDGVPSPEGYRGWATSPLLKWLADD